MKKHIGKIVVVVLICVGFLTGAYYPNVIEYLAIKKVKPGTVSAPNGKITGIERAKAQFMNDLERADLTVEQTKGLHNALSALRHERIGLPRLAEKAAQLYRFAKDLKGTMSEPAFNAFLDFALEHTQGSAANEKTSEIEQAKEQFKNDLKQANLTVEQTKGLHNALSALRHDVMGLPRLADEAAQLYRFAKGLKGTMSESDFNEFLDFALDHTKIVTAFPNFQARVSG